MPSLYATMLIQRYGKVSVVTLKNYRESPAGELKWSSCHCFFLGQSGKRTCWHSDYFAQSLNSAFAALWPGAPITPPPGCVPEPHR